MQGAAFFVSGQRAAFSRRSAIHRRAFWNTRSHGLASVVQSSGVQLICTLRNTRSGCGISAVKRPSGVVTDGEAAGAAVRVERIGLGRLAVVVDEAHRDDAPCAASPRCEKSAKPSPCATAIGMRLPAMPAKKIDGDVQHFDQRQTRLELLALVARELRPGLGAGDDRRPGCHHLAAVADAERERVGAAEERRELSASCGLKQDRSRPALAGAQRVAVAEAAAGDEALEVVEARAARCRSVMCTS